MHIALSTFVFYVGVVITCGLGLWKGDQALRAMSATTIISWSITPLLSHWDRSGSLNVPQTTIDVVTTLAYIWLSLRYRQLWTVFLCAASLLVVLCPFVDLADPRVHRDSWVAANNILAVSHIAILLVAFRLVVRARRRADEGTVQS